MEELKRIAKTVFKFVNTDSDGFIGKDECTEMYQDLNKDVTAEEVAQVVVNLMNEMGATDGKLTREARFAFWKK